jgi:hypothetical protein
VTLAGAVSFLDNHFAPTATLPIAFAIVEEDGAFTGRTSTLDLYCCFSSDRGSFGDREMITWDDDAPTSWISIPCVCDRERVEGIVKVLEARRTEYRRSHKRTTISVGDEDGTAARRTSDESRASSETSCDAIAAVREVRKVREASDIGSGNSTRDIAEASAWS